MDGWMDGWLMRRSRPEEIDVLERKKLQLQIEAMALSKEKDDASKQRHHVRTIMLSSQYTPKIHSLLYL